MVDEPDQLVLVTLLVGMNIACNSPLPEIVQTNGLVVEVLPPAAVAVSHARNVKPVPAIALNETTAPLA